MLHEIEVKDIHKAQLYEWGVNCFAWTLIDDKAFTIMQEKMQPNSQDELHYHSLATQFVYVISGNLDVEIEGAIYKLTPHQGIKIPVRKSHRVLNPYTDEANFLLFSVPGHVEDRILVQDK